MVILFGLLNALIVAFGKAFLKKGMEEVSSSVSFFFETLFGIFLWIGFAVIVGFSFQNILYLIPYVLISAILSEAYVFYVYSKGKISIVGPVFATYSIFTIFFSRILNNEILSPILLLSVFIVVLGVVVISIPKGITKDDLLDFKSVLWGLSGAIAVGVSDSMSKSVLDSTSPADFLFCLAIMQIPISIIYLFLEKQRVGDVSKVVRNIARYRYVLLSAFLIALSMIFFWLTLDSDLASISSPITSTNVLFIVILARVFLKEKIDKKAYLGILFIIAGVISIAVFNV